MKDEATDHIERGRNRFVNINEYLQKSQSSENELE